MKRSFLAAATLFILGGFSASPARAAVVTIDDFNSGKFQNALGNAAGAWGDPSDKTAGCNAALDDKVFYGDAGLSLRLDYDVESSKQNVAIPTNVSVQNPAQVRQDVFNGYFSLLKQFDARPYRYLVFWVKGDTKRGYTRSFKVELKDPQNSAGVLVDTVTDRWQKIVLPLEKFTAIKDWSRLKEFVIVFDGNLVTRKEGTLYLDDLQFTDTLGEPARTGTAQRRAHKAAFMKKPPNLNTSLQDWPESAYVELGKGKEFLESGAVTNSADLDAWFAVSWDKDFLYVAVDVSDNDVLNRNAGEHIWKDDLVELYIDPTDEGLTWGSDRYFQLGFSPDSADGGPVRWAWFQKRAPADDEVKSVIKKYADGYQMKLAVAWNFLGLRPAPGQTIGFSLAVHDRDTQDRTPEAKLNWDMKPASKTLFHLGRLTLK
ncbi:MAG TPA: sugar-binding protein [Elusimicrobiota bacterium]|nr:sugar-binding protein [Elusimicrobiota bacterium]